MASAIAILIANRALRTFGYGFVTVLTGIYLKLLGGGDAAVVAALGISLLSGAGMNALVAYYGDRFGRRRAMVVFGLLMALAGGILASAPGFAIALAALALGTTSPTGTEVSPFLSIEQSIVAEVAPEGRRTRTFAMYNLIGSFAGAAGALASGVPTLVLGYAPNTVDPLRPMFACYAVLGLAAAALSRSLPETVEAGRNAPRVSLSAQSRERISRISGLFAVDSFGGGFVVQSFVSFWFFTVYPESRAFLGVIFAGAGVLTALSFLLAARLGERFGLLETMVATHLPSNVLLILIPVVPGFHLALLAYLGRMALSQMDVPTRQAYLAGIVSREERTAANAASNTSRNLAQAAGPFSAGGVVAAVGLTAPFLIGGALRIAYDLAIFSSFRHVKPGSV